MARLNKEQAARKAAADKKKSQREAKKDSGLVEVLLSPEFPTWLLLTTLSAHLGITTSALVVELVEALPEAGLPHDPDWRTHDPTTKDIGLTLPKAIDARLGSYAPRLSARSVLEQIVLLYCVLVPEDALDHVDALDKDFEPWMVGTTLVFEHPTRDMSPVITGMAHMSVDELTLANGKPYNKYDARVEARKLAAIRARRGGGLHDPNDMVDWVNGEGV